MWSCRRALARARGVLRPAERIKGFVGLCRLGWCFYQGSRSLGRSLRSNAQLVPTTLLSEGRRARGRASAVGGDGQRRGAQGYQQSTVKEVIAQAGSSRSTFYEQFADMEDCLGPCCPCSPTSCSQKCRAPWSAPHRSTRPRRPRGRSWTSPISTRRRRACCSANRSRGSTRDGQPRRADRRDRRARGKPPAKPSEGRSHARPPRRRGDRTVFRCSPIECVAARAACTSSRTECWPGSTPTPQPILTVTHKASKCLESKASSRASSLTPARRPARAPGQPRRERQRPLSQPARADPVRLAQRWL